MTYIPAGTIITFKYDEYGDVDFLGVSVQALDAAALRDEYVAEFPDPEMSMVRTEERSALFCDWLVNTKQLITPITSMEWLTDLDNIQVRENRKFADYVSGALS